ncbi:MAG: aspartate/glutamate racemase family protein [Parvularculales bacterium]
MNRTWTKNTQFGGKTVYGASIGILMLETKFPRIPGDIGNATTWPFPVQFHVVKGATPHKVVREDPRVLIDDFIAAAENLVACGCDGITTNCGFLALMQDELKDAVKVPVATSSLMQVPMVQSLLPGNQRAGILTISKATLSADHLKACHVPPDTPIEGTDEGREFTQGILSDAEELDFEACRLDMLDAATKLTTDHKDVGAIVLECTNMTPYAHDIRTATGLPVFSIYSFLHWFQQALVPDQFPGALSDPRH